MNKQTITIGLYIVGGIAAVLYAAYWVLAVIKKRKAKQHGGIDIKIGAEGYEEWKAAIDRITNATIDLAIAAGRATEVIRQVGTSLKSIQIAEMRKEKASDEIRRAFGFEAIQEWETANGKRQ